MTRGVSRQALLSDVAQAAMAGESAANMTQWVSQLSTAALAGDCGSVIAVEGDDLHVRATFGFGSVVAGDLRVTPGTFAHHVVLTAAPVVVPLHAAETRFAPATFLIDQGVTSSVGVPVLNAGRVVAVLAVHSRRPRTFAAADVEFLSGLGSLLWLAVERAADHEVVIDGVNQRHALLRGVIKAQENERSQIAADIHDDAVQVMTAANLRLESFSRRLTDPEQIAVTRRIRDTVTLAIQRLRTLLFELSPPALDDDGLRSALGSHFVAGTAEAGLECVVRAEFPDSSLAPTTRAIAFRIIQEAMANVVKHAHASTVVVALKLRNDGLLATVTDDGVGCDVDALVARPGHIGLASMSGRAGVAGGWWRIGRAVGQGTVVTFWIPDHHGAQ